VVNQENSSLKSMGTDQLLDLFQLSSEEEEGKGKGEGEGEEEKEEQVAKKTGGPPKAILENLTELWDDSLYQEEYNTDNFIQSLNHWEFLV